MEIGRLVKEEICYEMKIRGLPDTKTVEEMRTQLRGFVRLEKSGMEVKYPAYPYKFEEDEKYLQEKVAEIRQLVEEFKDMDTSSDFRKITTKLVHAFNRANRAVAIKDDQIGKKSGMLVELVNLRSELCSKARKVKRASRREETPIDISALVLSSAESASDESDAETEVFIPAVEATSSPKQFSSDGSSTGKSIPVSKWNITKFDGESNRVSLSAFLENVEELRLSRNVTKRQLFDSARDLFAGKALIWYRAIRSTITDWEDLVKELRSQFQPVNFNEKLLEEIKARTQGPDESMGIYLAIMNNMFGRLTITVSEAVKLRILLRNIHPFYQSQIGLTDLDTIAKLLDFGRRLEARKESIESFKPPPRNRAALIEPDLAYVYASDQSQATASSVDTAETKFRCWRCQKPGHRANNCNAVGKDKVCYRCGNPNYTVRTCPKCNSGNASGRQ